MLLRFVTGILDEDSGQRCGAFQAAYDLRASGALAPHQEVEISALLEWFEENLKEPLRLRRNKKYHAANKAISWFKADAKVHVAQMYHLASLLDQEGIVVEVIKTDRPGFVVYEDAFQVVAEPFRDSGA